MVPLVLCGYQFGKIQEEKSEKERSEKRWGREEASPVRGELEVAANQTMAMRSSRLMKEWMEIQRCPVANASISPLNEENLNDW
jgi:hypothetical protein